MNYENIDIEELLPRDWLEILDTSIVKQTNEKLQSVIRKAREDKLKIFPVDQNNIFRVFKECPFEKVRVVILGQDPYYAHPRQANGIAFSVHKGVTIPPSLRNMFKELEDNHKEKHGDLTRWVQQGVFLLNSALTINQGQPSSHMDVWCKFTEQVINKLQERNDIIYCLWGKFAEQKEHMITNSTAIVFKNSHPSPLSAYKTDAPFIGSKIFVKVNDELQKLGYDKIDW